MPACTCSITWSLSATRRSNGAAVRGAQPVLHFLVGGIVGPLVGGAQEDVAEVVRIVSVPHSAPSDFGEPETAEPAAMVLDEFGALHGRGEIRRRSGGIAPLRPVQEDGVDVETGPHQPREGVQIHLVVTELTRSPNATSSSRSAPFSAAAPTALITKKFPATPRAADRSSVDP